MNSLSTSPVQQLVLQRVWVRYNLDMRVPSGGPATINGVLYQMLWCLLTAAAMRVHAPRNAGGDITQATLVLEPSRGGDVTLRGAASEQVVQLKARADASAWSLRELVYGILPDLYRAVDLGREQDFVLLTEGHLGGWGEAYNYFQRLHSIPVPDAGNLVLPLLDAGRIVQFSGTLKARVRDADTGVNGGARRQNVVTQLGERELFEQIAAILRDGHPNIQRDTEEETQRKLLRLLSRLECRWDQVQARLHEQLLRDLRSFVDNPDTAGATLDRLLTALARRATSGNAVIDANEFFAEHGLRGVPLVRRQWPRLVEAGAEQVQRDLDHLFGYKPAADVRPGGPALFVVPEVEQWRRGGADCLILPGESGQGKTWRLCALALALAADAPVVIMTADGGVRQAAEDAAHRFWFGLCNRKNTMRLDQIARHLRDTGAVPPGWTWLYVLVDGVETLQDTQALHREIGGVDGVRLAFTISERVAERLSQVPNAPAAVTLPVDDFTEEELRRYVAGGDSVRWYDIRDEGVRQVIRRPLLAWIYRTLVGEDGWNAQNEYGLYDGYLRLHVFERLRDMDLFTAETPLIRAGLALWDGKRYPWSLEQMEVFGLGNDLIAPLLRLGFLRRDAQGHYAVWHDRIKEWLTARALARALEDGRRDARQVGARCHDLLFQDPQHTPSEDEQRRQMRYVPMDLCWHLAGRMADSPTAADALNELLRRIEEDPVHHRAYESLYEGLLPTIGPAIAPAVFRRLRDGKGDSQGWLEQRRWSMTKCLAGLDAQTVAPDAIGLLEHDEEDVRRAAADILTSQPIPAALPVLWRRYRELREECEARDARRHASGDDYVAGGEEDPEGSRNPFQEEMAVWKALVACAPLHPDWIADQIRQLPVPGEADDAPPVDALVRLLCHARDSGERWRACKDVLRQWTIAGLHEQVLRREWAFAEAVHQWRDSEEVAWLRARVKSQDWGLVGLCLRALARVAPDVAVETLPNLSPGFFASTHKRVLRCLLARRPDKTREMLTRLILEDGERRWDYAQVFSAEPEALTESALNCLLNDLYDDMQQDDGDVRTLWKRLDCVEGVTDLSLLRTLWQRGRQGWDAALARLLIEKGPMPHHNFMLETATNVLVKAGGAGFTQVVNFWLQAEEPYARLNGGIPTAHLRPDAETIRLLERLALYPDRAAEDSGDDKRKSLLSRLAQKTLAQSGAWKPLIRSIVQRAQNSHRDVINDRVGQAPLSDEDMAPALAALEANSSHSGAILALGVGQRSEKIPHIVAVLNAEDVRTDNAVTNACQHALALMPNLPPEAVDALAKRLPYTKAEWFVRPALMNNGSAAALEVLIRHLRTGLYRFRQGTYDVSDVNDVASVARYLLGQSTVGGEAAALCRERFSLDKVLDPPAQQMVTAIAPLAAEHSAARAALECQPAQDFLRLRAFQPDGTFRYVGDKARSMRGLAAYEPEDAYVAARRALWNEDVHDREYAPYLLLDINPARALTDLVTFLASPKAKLRMRHHVAYALAERAGMDNNRSAAEVSDLLLQQTRSPQAQERHAACHALGFLVPRDEVVEAVRDLMEDEDVNVFEAACEAWHRLEAARRVEELAGAFLVEKNAAKRWILIEAALEIGDLGDAHRLIPRWLQRMSERLAPLEWDYVVDKVSKRRKERDKGLRREEERE